MPIYEYRCDTCGESFELLRSMSLSDADAPCPKCGAPAKKKLSVFACSLRGPSGSSTAGAASCPAIGPGGT